MADCLETAYEIQQENIDKRVTKIEMQITALVDRINDLESEGKLTEYQFKEIMKSLDELKTDMNEIKEKPSRRWETIAAAAIAAVVGFLISIILK